MTIPGVQQRTAEVLIAEIGVDMSAFPTPKHLASWAGVCPGNNESAGKRRSGKTRKGSKWLDATLDRSRAGRRPRPRTPTSPPNTSASADAAATPRPSPPSATRSSPPPGTCSKPASCTTTSAATTSPAKTPTAHQTPHPTTRSARTPRHARTPGGRRLTLISLQGRTDPPGSGHSWRLSVISADEPEAPAAFGRPPRVAAGGRGDSGTLRRQHGWERQPQLRTRA